MNTRTLELLKVFSIWTNGRSLFSVAQRSTNHMEFLNGMRVLSITWVIVGHSYMMGASSPNINTISILDVRPLFQHFVSNDFNFIVL